jgi:hypothetical protein
MWWRRRQEWKLYLDDEQFDDGVEWLDDDGQLQDS